jgi:hypothetical protein
MTTIRADHPALKGARTIFLKSIKNPNQTGSVIKPADTNTKLSAGKNKVMKGPWKGMRLYQILLEERATCPKTCQQWAACYGNNMPFAHRINQRSPKFFPTLERELAELAEKNSNGFVIRLHVLGDFYSKTYVNFWIRMLKRHPELKIFGYTHRWPEHKDGIGKAIERLNAAGAWIRFSDRGGEMSANVEGEGIQCPQEVGKTESCLTCGLCWHTTKPVRFIKH